MNTAIGGSNQPQSLFSHDQPLGPPAIIPELHLSSLSTLYLSELRPYGSAMTPTHATYLMGRRGSGKTTLLVAAEGFDSTNTINLFETDILTGMLDLVQSIERDLHFTLSLENRVELWKAIFDFAAGAHLAQDLSAPSHAAERMQIRQFLTCLRNESQLDLKSITDYARAIEEYILRRAREDIKGPLTAWLNSLTLDNVSLGDIRTYATLILQEEGRHITVLIDALEELLNHPQQYSDVLRPLFARLGRQAMTGMTGSGLYLRCCLPTELYDQLANLSDNPTKDFRGVCNIQWDTADLIRLVAARYSQFADSLAAQGDDRLKRALFSSKSEPRVLLESILPLTVRNSCNREEETLPYLLRHTQLLPRQVLIVFNYLLQGADTVERITGGERLDPRITLDAVMQAEHELTQEVVNAFTGYWPGISPALASLVPQLEPTFTPDDLRALFKDLGLRRHARDTSRLITRLVKVGVIGKIREETERYVVGEFAYVYPRGMSAIGASRLCLHPMFARYNGRSAYDHKPIYPAPSSETRAPLFG